MTSVYVHAPEVCTKRSLDATRIQHYLQNNNYHLTSEPQHADYLIFVTCAVGDRRTEFCLNTIQKLQTYPGTLIVTGCLPAIEPQELNKLFKGTSIATKNLDAITSFFPPQNSNKTSLPDANILFHDVHKKQPITSLKTLLKKIQLLQWIESRANDVSMYILRDMLGEQSPVYKSFTRPHYYIRISWGCLGQCTYCGIKKAIGTHKSKPAQHIIKEFKAGLQNGYTQFILTGDDVGAWGTDHQQTLPDLLDKITRIRKKFEITLTDLHPQWIIKNQDAFERVLKRKKITLLDVPLQSGNSRILSLMKRYHQVDTMKESLKKLRKIYPRLCLTTQHIAGFPSETKEEFQETLTLTTDLKFDGGLIYPFSLKTGTEAEHINPKLPNEEIIRRLTHAKQHLRKHNYSAVYRSLLFSPRIYRCVGFIKK